MDKLEKLIQDESGALYRPDGRLIENEDIHPVGKIKTIIEANPCIDVSQIIDKRAEEFPSFVPYNANSYVASDFNPDTQHIRKSNLEGGEKFYSVYAIQFYYVHLFKFI